MTVPVLLLLLTLAATGLQADEARLAIERGEYVRAINLLTGPSADTSLPETSLYLGVAYGRMREWELAEKTLREGAAKFPNDSRFHTELANVFLAANEVEKAKAALNEALTVNPEDPEAADRLASLAMSEGDEREALDRWNRVGQPILGDVLHNSYKVYGNWTIGAASAFDPGDVIRFDQWRTTERRLLETGIYSNAGMDIEPALEPKLSNVNILTSPRTNTLSDILFDAVKGAPIETTYFDLWNLGNSGMSLNSSYRWNANRRRAEVRLRSPLPVPGILYLDMRGLWRSEQWDVSGILREGETGGQFLHKSTGTRVTWSYIPHFRVEFGAGFEYLNRAGSGGPAGLAPEDADAGKILMEAAFRLADGNYRNRLLVEGFLARKSLPGELQYSGGTAEFNNRLLLDEDGDLILDWTLKAGTARGELPIEDYFIVGLNTRSRNLLRGHPASRGGRYGSAPMGTDFGLINVDLERRIAVLPLFNTLSFPYLNVKVEVFVDAARTADRNRIFEQGTLWVDTGAALKLETPTHALNLVYGRSLRDGSDAVGAYIERRW